MLPSDLPQDVFLFAEENRHFLAGARDTLYIGRVDFASFFARVFFGFIALPVSLIMAMTISAMTGITLMVTICICVGLAFLISVYIYKTGQAADHKLRTAKTVLVATVLRYDFATPLNFFDRKEKTYLLYGVTRPDGKHVERWTQLRANRSHFHDGQALPRIGQTIVVLYADEQHMHIL